MIVLGLLTVVLAGNSLITGIHNPLYGSMPIPELPNLDSNLRFMGGMGLGLGLILLWIVPTIERQTVLFRAVWICAFLGGIGRIISIFAVGPAAPAVTAFTIIEVIAVPFFLYWQSTVARSHIADK